ncbi:dermonecrotic toxin domain-containing protein [Pseudomonas sp. NPDC007930]|uniref:dermonecrotic toxin domain-containing protein n=1 Tax=Pseudomonas sp. NPDC007930 TaxID=3364417 RepID=UPI0036E3A059
MSELPFAQSHLHDLAKLIAQACPDLREQVRALAVDFLAQHNLASHAPEQVYWHRFNDQVSDPQAFSGWVHYQPPAESLTLVELIMQRFNSNAQDATDELDVSTGFYTVGPTAERYDSSNEVPLLPSVLLAWLWKIDFKTDFLRYATVFWEDHRDDYRLLAKAHFMGEVLEERQALALSDADAQWLFNALAGGASAPLTLPVLEETHSAAADARVYLLQVGEYVSTDILCAETANGEHFVWMPGEVNAIQKYSSLEALHWWLLMQNKDPEPRARFMLHFALDTHLEGRGSGLNPVIDLLYSTWGRSDRSLIHHPDQRLEGDAFAALAEQARLRMLADANATLHSNAEQREKIWLGYLGAFNQVFGPMAAVDWPVSLAVVGAGLASMGLNIDQAVHAPTHGERKAAVIGAITAGIDVLFNGLYLWGAWAGSTAAEGTLEGELAKPPEPEASEPPADAEPTVLPGIDALPEGPIYLDTPEALVPFETNVLLDAYSAGTEGVSQGIYALPDGQTYASVAGRAYAVRYAPELTTWVVVDPENPFSFHRSVPLRPVGDGEWEVVPRPGLNGGGKLDRLLPWVRQRRPAALVPRVAQPYDLPAEYETELADIMTKPGDRRLEGYILDLENSSDIATAFSDAQTRLTADAEAFFKDVQPQSHPEVPELAAQTPPKQVLRAIFARSRGLVIGEAHWARAPKQLLIEQMERMAKEGVDTLFMEHLLSDAHQADLDLFHSSGEMPERLERYLKVLDTGQNTDPTGRYTFANVVKAAQKNGIHVRALDCGASYKVRIDPFNNNDTLRQRLMNYYAHQVISSEPPVGKWIALVGNSHTDVYLEVPGLADLEGVISLRAEDVPPGTAGGFSADPGGIVLHGEEPGVLLKSDLRFRAPFADERSSRLLAVPPAEKLTQPGQFVLVDDGSQLQLIHRDRTGELVYTPVERYGTQYTLQRPQWSQISGRRFDTLDALFVALRQRGLKRVL